DAIGDGRVIVRVSCRVASAEGERASVRLVATAYQRDECPALDQPYGSHAAILAVAAERTSAGLPHLVVTSRRTVDAAALAEDAGMAPAGRCAPLPPLP
ncbi:MAG: hypothetical protein ACT4PP_05310, partial [Sporichthyaceae bacterium]